jgi:hypothetical protein
MHPGQHECANGCLYNQDAASALPHASGQAAMATQQCMKMTPVKKTYTGKLGCHICLHYPSDCSTGKSDTKRCVALCAVFCFFLLYCVLKAENTKRNKFN